MSLSCKYDEKYVYFRVHKDDFHFGNETLYVPIDTTPKSGSTACDGIAPLFEQEADFVLIISGREDTKILVQERYEALRAMYSQRVYGEDAYLNVPEKDTGKFRYAS